MKLEDQSCSHAAERAAAVFSRLPGGRYEARQNDDGTWDVVGLPIFAPVKKGVKGAPRAIGERALRGAVATHSKKFADDKFLPRLNVLHNYGIHRPTPAGFFLPREVRSFRMAGKTLPVVFADLLSVPDEVFRELDQDKLPYCSVEIRTYEPLAFGALALLDTEPPFFEFPLITIGSKHYAEVVAGDHEEQPVAVARFRFFEEKDMEGEDKKKDEKEYAEGEGMGVDGVVKSIESGEISIADFAAIRAAMQAVESPGEEEKPEQSVEDEAVSAAMSARDNAKDDEIAKLRGRVAALESHRARDRVEKERESHFDATVKALSRDGFNLPDETIEQFRAAAAEGRKSLDATVKVFRAHATKDPPEDIDDFPSGATEWPAEVMAYAAKGADQFSEAKTAFSQWSEMPADNLRSSLAKFLEREVG